MSIGQFIEIKPQLLERIESALNESTYRDAIENSSKYNNQLVKERKTRLPFIDPQTGVAQSNCFLWMDKWERMPGINLGQIYSYPSRRWRRKRRSYLISLNHGSSNSSSNGNKCNRDEELASLNVDHLIKTEANESSLDRYDLSKDNWLHDFDDESDPPDAGELEETASSDSSGEYTPRKKKKTKKETPVKKRKNQSSHHPQHHSTHSNSSQSQSQQHSVPLSSPATSSHPSSSRNTPTNDPTEDHAPKVKDKDGKAAPNKYCDFCLGDSDENKKTKSAERMVSCSDCGRSAHPTCLQFTPRMVLSVKKYRWQCIECKSCAVCGTSDNDEQLLFCDDCDRGYHMYCLDPPISEPPEGSWSCALCIAEYHTPKQK